MNGKLSALQQKYNLWKNDKEKLQLFLNSLANRFSDVEALTIGALYDQDLIGGKTGLEFLCRIKPENAEYKNALGILSDVDPMTGKSARLLDAVVNLGIERNSPLLHALCS